MSVLWLMYSMNFYGIISRMYNHSSFVTFLDKIISNIAFLICSGGWDGIRIGWILLSPWPSLSTLSFYILYLLLCLSIFLSSIKLSDYFLSTLLSRVDGIYFIFWCYFWPQTAALSICAFRKSLSSTSSSSSIFIIEVIFLSLFAYLRSFLLGKCMSSYSDYVTFRKGTGAVESNSNR